jgi:hypothetical protein
MTNILARARTVLREYAANHPQAISLGASAIRFATMMIQGTESAGRPAVVGVCVAINLTVDYLERHLTR